MYISTELLFNCDYVSVAAAKGSVQAQPTPPPTMRPNRRGRRMHYGIVAGAQPSRFDRLIAARGIQRSWLRLDTELMETLATGMTVPILTDDYAPVERLLANYCSLRFLATIGINIGRPEACGERRS